MSESWYIAVDQPEPLVIALYVRDALRLPVQVEPVIPALEPSVSHSGLAIPAEQRVMLCDEWGAWWRRLIMDGDLLAVLAEAETPPGLAPYALLRRVLLDARLLASAHQWAAARHAEHAEAVLAGPADQVEEAVAAAEQRTGTRLDGLALRITVLPVVGQAAWPLGRSAFAVSTGLWSDQARFTSWLADVLVAGS